MKRLVGLTALLVSGWLFQPAFAQAPSSTVGPQTRQATAARRDATGRPAAAARREAYYRGYNEDARWAGYRNPGGVGRYEEYYPAGNRFQNGDRNPVPVATFNGSSGVPTMEEQIAAQQLGVAKYNAIQQSIDNYARPYYGFGFYGGFN